jgi:hypothetical protein
MAEWTDGWVIVLYGQMFEDSDEAGDSDGELIEKVTDIEFWIYGHWI